MASDLKRKTLIGMVWSAVERFSAQLITFVLSLVIARLVTPDDYGVLAIVMVFVTVSGVFVDGGFANALVQKVDCDDVDRSTVFYFNIVVSVVLYLVLYLLSPTIAHFYHNEALIWLVRCAGVVVIINSIAIVQLALLNAKIDFKRQTIISVSSAIVSGGVGVTLAYLGYGVWALVTQSIVQALMRTILLTSLLRWRPLWCFSWDSFRSLFGYSSKLLLSNLISIGGNESMQLIIGRVFNTANLGYYNYSHRMANFPSSNISVTIQRVLFPSFCQIQQDNERLSAQFRKSLVLSMLVIVPIMFSLSALAQPIIALLLTPQWYKTIPILQVFAVTKAIYPLMLFNMNILWVKRRSDLTLKLEIVNVVINFILIATLYKYDLLLLCLALCGAEALKFLLYAILVGRINAHGLLPQLRDLLPIYFSAALAALLTHQLVLPLIPHTILQIVVGVPSIVLLYLLIILLIPGYVSATLKGVIARLKGMLHSAR